MTFDPAKHLINIKGKSYLPVEARIAWFRATCPGYRLSTEIVALEADRAVVRAVVADGDGAIVATAHGSAIDDQKATWAGQFVEKAETAAIGRALAHLGFKLPDGTTAHQPRQQQPEKPQNSAWGDGAMFQAWLKTWNERGLKNDEIKSVLGIQKPSQWAGTVAEADERLEAVLNADVPF